jgi:hypothetical protein
LLNHLAGTPDFRKDVTASAEISVKGKSKWHWQKYKAEKLNEKTILLVPKVLREVKNTQGFALNEHFGCAGIIKDRDCRATRKQSEQVFRALRLEHRREFGSKALGAPGYGSGKPAGAEALAVRLIHGFSHLEAFDSVLIAIEVDVQAVEKRENREKRKDDSDEDHNSSDDTNYSHKGHIRG